MVVGYPAGGTTDVIARILADPLAEKLGSPVVVENRAGAGGIVGASEVAGANPDGYTLLMAASPEIAIGPAIGREMPYDPQQAFTPISLVCTLPQMLVVNADVPADTVEELIELAKERPGELNFASFGTGTSNHLVGELFKSETGIDVVHVPYKGGAPAMTDLLGGRVEMMFESVSAVQAHAEAGNLKPLGFAYTERSELLPDVPTMDETGVGGFVGGSWVGLLAPEGTPEDIVQQVSTAVSEVLQEPAVAEQLAARGIPCPGTGPDEFRSFIESEIGKWKDVASRAGIEAN